MSAAGDKLKCMKCAAIIVDEMCQWISSTGWKPHITSKVHGHALLHEQQLHQRDIDIACARDIAMQEEIENGDVPLNNQLIGSSSLPAVSIHVPTAAEEVMWDAFEIGDGSFDAGIAQDDAADRQ